MKQKLHTHNTESVLCSITEPGRGVIPLEETCFPYPSRNQLQIASGLGVGPCVLFPFSVLGFCLVPTCVGLVHDVAVSVSSYAHQPVCLYHLWLWHSFSTFLPPSLPPALPTFLPSFLLRMEARVSRMLMSKWSRWYTLSPQLNLSRPGTLTPTWRESLAQAQTGLGDTSAAWVCMRCWEQSGNWGKLQMDTDRNSKLIFFSVH